MMSWATANRRLVIVVPVVIAISLYPLQVTVKQRKEASK